MVSGASRSGEVISATSGPSSGSWECEVSERSPYDKADESKKQSIRKQEGNPREI
jgi:hypothetical protein